MAEVASYDLVPTLELRARNSGLPRAEHGSQRKRLLEPASGDGTLENLIKLFEPQFSYA